MASNGRPNALAQSRSSGLADALASSASLQGVSDPLFGGDFQFAMSCLIPPLKEHFGRVKYEYIDRLSRRLKRHVRHTQLKFDHKHDGSGAQELVLSDTDSEVERVRLRTVEREKRRAAKQRRKLRKLREREKMRSYSGLSTVSNYSMSKSLMSLSPNAAESPKPLEDDEYELSDEEALSALSDESLSNDSDSKQTLFRPREQLLDSEIPVHDTANPNRSEEMLHELLDSLAGAIYSEFIRTYDEVFNVIQEERAERLGNAVIECAKLRDDLRSLSNQRDRDLLSFKFKLSKKEKQITYIRKTLYRELVALREELFHVRNGRGSNKYRPEAINIFDWVTLADDEISISEQRKQEISEIIREEYVREIHEMRGFYEKQVFDLEAKLRDVTTSYDALLDAAQRPYSDADDMEDDEMTPRDGMDALGQPPSPFAMRTPSPGDRLEKGDPSSDQSSSSLLQRRKLDERRNSLQRVAELAFNQQKEKEVNVLRTQHREHLATVSRSFNSLTKTVESLPKQVDALMKRIQYHEKLQRQRAKQLRQSAKKKGVPAPTGTLAMVFTDVENSTKQWDEYPEEMEKALDVHFAIMRRCLDKNHGYEVKTEGDGVFASFQDPFDAAMFCIEFQEDLLLGDWPEKLLMGNRTDQDISSTGAVLFRGLKVRMGFHLGTPTLCREDSVSGRMDYFGPAVNRAARVGGAAYGGQILLSGVTWERIKDRIQSLDNQPICVDRGEHYFKGLKEPEQVYELLPSTLSERSFGPVRTSKPPVPQSVAEVIQQHKSLFEVKTEKVFQNIEAVRHGLDEANKDVVQRNEFDADGANDSSANLPVRIPISEFENEQCLDMAGEFFKASMMQLENELAVLLDRYHLKISNPGRVDMSVLANGRSMMNGKIHELLSMFTQHHKIVPLYDIEQQDPPPLTKLTLPEIPRTPSPVEPPIPQVSEPAEKLVPENIYEGKQLRRVSNESPSSELERQNGNGGMLSYSRPNSAYGSELGEVEGLSHGSSASLLGNTFLPPNAMSSGSLKRFLNQPGTENSSENRNVTFRTDSSVKLSILGVNSNGDVSSTPPERTKSRQNSHRKVSVASSVADSKHGAMSGSSLSSLWATSTGDEQRPSSSAEAAGSDLILQVGMRPNTTSDADSRAETPSKPKPRPNTSGKPDEEGQSVELRPFMRSRSRTFDNRDTSWTTERKRAVTTAGKMGSVLRRQMENMRARQALGQLHK